MTKLPASPDAFKVLALYNFVPLSGLETLRAALMHVCAELGIRGTLILAGEGINGTIAGEVASIDALLARLGAEPETAALVAGARTRISFAPEMPFLRMKVRIKPEIVTLRAPEADPARRAGTYVEPEAWNGLIAREDVLVIDTRNAYEVALGRFAGALDPGTDHFTRFKDFVAEQLDPRENRAIAMYCTGGIRCEKASSYLLAHGFEEVYHLKGGILAYLDAVPETESLWQGECFVFDERVSVVHGLAPGEAALCRACRHPLTPAERAHPDYEDGIRCPHCASVLSPGRRRALIERNRQIELAEMRGSAHLGDDAMLAAGTGRARKRARRASDRARGPVRP